MTGGKCSVSRNRGRATEASYWTPQGSDDEDDDENGHFPPVTNYSKILSRKSNPATANAPKAENKNMA